MVRDGLYNPAMPKVDRSQSAPTPNQVWPTKKPVGFWKSLIIGLTGGVGGGLVSLGGGTLLVPLLTGWAKLDMYNARGTALAVSILSASVGGLMYALGGRVDWLTVVWTGLAMLITTPIVARASAKVRTGLLRRVFGLVVILGGAILVFKDSLYGSHSLPAEWIIPYLVFIGLVAGAVAGLIGVSGGPVLAPMFVLGLGIGQQLAQGSSLLSRIPGSVSGTVVNWRMGLVRRDMIPGLFVGAVLGALIGSRLALLLPEHQLRLLFGLLLVALGIGYLRSKV